MASPSISRRRFLQTSGVSAAALAVAGSTSANAAALPRAADGTSGSRGAVGVGMEVRGHPFIDAAKVGNAFTAVGGGEVATDTHGWPLADCQRVFFDYRPVAAWLGQIDDPEGYQIDVSGTYHLSFTGRATIGNADVSNVTVSNQQYDARKDLTTADVTVPPGSGLLALTFTDTHRVRGGSAGISDVRLIIPGYSTQARRLTPRALSAALKPFGVTRFMGVLETNGKVSYDANGTIPLEWSERKKPADAHQTGQMPGSNDAGWAWEYVVDVGNEAQIDIWINVPVAASNDYVRHLAELIRRRARPNRTIYVEYSNEVWNPGFLQFGWNQLSATTELQADPGSVLNYDGTAIKPDGSVDTNVANRRRFARRTMEISKIFESVFGPNALGDRIRVVMPWFALFGSGTDNTRDMLTFISDNYGSPARYFWAIAVTGYMSLDSLTDNGVFPDGLSVSQILQAEGDSIPTYYPDYGSIAKDFGLRLTAYEGGNQTSVGGGGGTGSVGNRIEAARTRQMAQFMTENYQAFFSGGGALFMELSLSTAYSRYGTWGITDDVTIPDRNYMYGAAADAARTHRLR